MKQNAEGTTLPHQRFQPQYAPQIFFLPQSAFQM